MGKSKSLDGSFYHVFNKSVENLKIFEPDHFKFRFCQALSYYNNKNCHTSLSAYLRNPESPTLPRMLSYENYFMLKILAFCIMPNHYHLLVKSDELSKLSRYIQIVENSFTRYYNLTHKRKGPLWQSRFKHVNIRTNAQLLHVSRYIHLNPTSSSLVENPEDWEYSSYRAYIKESSVLFEDWSDIHFRSTYKYKKFNEDRKDFQRKLKRIKNHLF